MNDAQWIKEEHNQCRIFDSDGGSERRRMGRIIFKSLFWNEYPADYDHR
jgi:hypothetical protein